MILLDTNIVSEIMRPKPNGDVVNWLKAQSLDQLALTSVTLAEIRYGLARISEGKRKLELENRFEFFIERGFGDRIVDFDKVSAEIYGKVVVDREKIGKPIESFDAMIAAIAISRQAKLATRDISGFEECGIEIINPWES